MNAFIPLNVWLIGALGTAILLFTALRIIYLERKSK